MEPTTCIHLLFGGVKRRRVNYPRQLMGLTSLKSLGLTSADLYAMGKPAGGE